MTGRRLALVAALAIDINDAVFSWDWTPGAEPPATAFRLKCERGLGVLPTVVIPITRRTFPVQGVIGGPGFYRCVITSANAEGESAPSAPVYFRRRGHSIIPEAP